MVVIGGGRVAERKVISLHKTGANVTVVSPRLTKKLQKDKTEKKIRHLSRNYKISDLKGAFLVIAATDSPEINRRVAENAPALVNVVDVPSQCNFIAPSVIKRGSLMIAISTSGTSPALSRAIRKELQILYGPEVSEYLKFVRSLRGKALSRIKEKGMRERFLKSLASENILRALRTKGLNEVKRTLLVRFRRLESKY